MKNYLKGKKVLVTGGAGGIGLAVVNQLVQAGSLVTVVDVKSARNLNSLTRNKEIELVMLDVRDRGGVLEKLMPLAPDFLVLAHGALGQTGTLFDQPPESAQRLVDVNILGVQNCLQAIVPGMLARDEGHVVFLGSVAIYPSVGQPIYSATKAAVHNMASNLRMEVFPAKIRVTEVRPGRVRSGMHSEMFGGSMSEANKRVYDPVQTIEVDEIAEGIVWALNKPAHLNVTALEMVATEHVIGGVRYKGM